MSLITGIAKGVDVKNLCSANQRQFSGACVSIHVAQLERYVLNTRGLEIEITTVKSDSDLAYGTSSFFGEFDPGSG